MRTALLVFLFFLCTPAHARDGVPPARQNVIVGADEGIFPFRWEPGRYGCSDLVRFTNGQQRLGKAMEWADQVLLFDSAGHVETFAAGEVAQIEFRRFPGQMDLPKLPDLTVAYVERLPRDPSLQGHVNLAEGVSKADAITEGAAWRPVDGAKVTFRVHVLNAGGAKSEAVPARILLDGKELSRATVNPLECGREQAIEVPWSWQTGAHTLRIELDPEAKQKEVVRWNNAFEERTDAQSVAVVVARDRYESFRRFPSMGDSFCFDDWVQYQLRSMNGLLRGSVYPGCPQGVRERLRCDRIVVVQDPDDSATREQWGLALRRDGKAGGLAEEGALLVFGKLTGKDAPLYDNVRIDWPTQKRLGRELGLVDLTATDTTIQQCNVPDMFDRYAVRQHLFPYPRTLMHTPGGSGLDELSAIYLNETMGKPRGFRGEYLFRVPSKIAVEVRANSGTVLAGVQVDAFQLQSAGDYRGQISGAGRDPLYSSTTDAEGRLDLPNLEVPPVTTPNGYALRANPFGKIATDGSNGLLMLRLRHTHETLTREEFHFIRLYDCCLAAAHGQAESLIIPLQTRFPTTEAPLSPPYALVVMEDRASVDLPMLLRWRTATTLLMVDEFRIYRKTGFGGEGESPWMLSACCRKTGKRWNLESEIEGLQNAVRNGYSADSAYAITAVDKSGRESGLSNTAFLTAGKRCVKFAIDTEAAFMTLSGPGPVQMLRWDAIAGTQPFSVKTTAFPGYRPAFSGIAITPEHRIAVSDSVNHVIAIYDLGGNLEELMPRRSYWPGFPSDDEGAFYDPVDLAIDKSGRMYVADRGNNRVQVLDAQGHFVSRVDPDFKFIGPHSVAFSNGRLCVTDNAGSRVRVYRVEGDSINFERELPPVMDVDRAVVSAKGKIYCTGLDPESKKRGVLVFAGEDNTARLESAQFEGEMGKVYDPISAYLYDYLADNYLYVVNKFPFDVRRFKME